MTARLAAVTGTTAHLVRAVEPPIASTQMHVYSRYLAVELRAGAHGDARPLSQQSAADLHRLELRQHHDLSFRTHLHQRRCRSWIIVTSKLASLAAITSAVSAAVVWPVILISC